MSYSSINSLTFSSVYNAKSRIIIFWLTKILLFLFYEQTFGLKKNKYYPLTFIKNKFVQSWNTYCSFIVKKWGSKSRLLNNHADLIMDHSNEQHDSFSISQYLSG